MDEDRYGFFRVRRCLTGWKEASRQHLVDIRDGIMADMRLIDHLDKRDKDRLIDQKNRWHSTRMMMDRWLPFFRPAISDQAARTPQALLEMGKAECGIARALPSALSDNLVGDMLGQRCSVLYDELAAREVAPPATCNLAKPTRTK